MANRAQRKYGTRLVMGFSFWVRRRSQRLDRTMEKPRVQLKYRVACKSIARRYRAALGCRPAAVRRIAARYRHHRHSIVPIPPTRPHPSAQLLIVTRPSGRKRERIAMSALIDTTIAAAPSPAHLGPVPTRRNQGKDHELSALMQRAQDGDRIAYSSLLKEVVSIVKRVLQSRMGFLSHADREDILQDILLSLHAARATYDPERPFTPWLMTIIHNRTVDHARRYSRRSSHEVLVDELPIDMADENADTASDAYGDPDALRRAVKDLPKGQRVAIELLKLREMSLKEAAE